VPARWSPRCGRRPQATSRESLAGFRTEAAAAVEAAKASEENAKTKFAKTADALQCTGAQWRAADAAAGQLREELAAALATNASLERRLVDASGRSGSRAAPR
jgi:hypothetical protein